jgi:hypothetical protein
MKCARSKGRPATRRTPRRTCPATSAEIAATSASRGGQPIETNLRTDLAWLRYARKASLPAAVSRYALRRRSAGNAITSMYPCLSPPARMLRINTAGSANRPSPDSSTAPRYIVARCIASRNRRTRQAARRMSGVGSNFGQKPSVLLVMSPRPLGRAGPLNTRWVSWSSAGRKMGGGMPALYLFSPRSTGQGPVKIGFSSSAALFRPSVRASIVLCRIGEAIAINENGRGTACVWATAIGVIGLSTSTDPTLTAPWVYRVGEPRCHRARASLVSGLGGRYRLLDSCPMWERRRPSTWVGSAGEPVRHRDVPDPALRRRMRDPCPCQQLPVARRPAAGTVAARSRRWVHSR